MMSGSLFCPYSPVLTRTPLSVAAKGKSKPFPLGADTISFWYRGRVAIWQGIKALGIKAGERILVPAYACGSEIDPLVRAGLDLVFYKVTADLSADMEDLERLCERPCRALFVTHYFGFAQPTRELLAFARSRQMLLVEDTTHGLYSRDEQGTPLGSLGHMSVFSFKKTIAVPDGALLFINAPGAAACLPRGHNPGVYSLLGWLRTTFESELRLRQPALGAWISENVTRAFARRFKHHVVRPLSKAPAASGAVPGSMSLAPEWTERSMSQIARMLLARVDDRYVVERRRHNFQVFLDGLTATRDTRPLLKSLPDGCCPLVFPLWTSDPKSLVTHLRRHGVIGSRHWVQNHPAVPLSAFPFERDLKSQVIAVPIHQGLREAHVHKMIELVDAWSRRA